MPPPDRDSTVTVSAGQPPPPPPPLDPVLQELHQVLELTSLHANAGQPARLANLTHSNVIANTNRSTQNAVANQQAHAQLAIAVLGKASNAVSNLGPLSARASVDVLTQDEVAQTLADLSSVLLAFGGGSGPTPGPNDFGGLIKALRRLLREIAHIMKVNARVSGHGTPHSPYAVSEGLLFVAGSIALGFPVPPDQLKFAPSNHGVQVGA